METSNRIRENPPCTYSRRDDKIVSLKQVEVHTYI